MVPLLHIICFCTHLLPLLSLLHLITILISDYCPFVLVPFPPFPSSHSSIPLCFCPSVCCFLCVGTCIAVPLVGSWPAPPLLYSCSCSPTPTFLAILFFFPFLHVCQGLGGSTQCSAQWPKSEYLRNCQLSPIIRGSP